MKKALLLAVCAAAVFAGESVLSDEKQELLQLKREKIREDITLQKREWVSPLRLSLSINRNKSATFQESETKSAGVDWSQDLFRSGGIGYSIDQAKALGMSRLLGVDREEAEYLKQAYTLYAQCERDRLKLRQNELTLHNRDLDLFIITAKYKAGSADISELNRATIDRDTARTALIASKNVLRNEEYGLKKLLGEAQIDPDTLSSIPLISKEEYLKQHLELLQYEAQDRSDEAGAKIVRSAYLPKLTFNGSYGYTDYQSERIEYAGNNYNYGATLSMPLDINTKAQMLSSRLQLLQTRTARLDRSQELEQEYAMRFFTIADYEERIGVAQEMLVIYQELYSFTQQQVTTGAKTVYELESLGNSVQIQELEKEIQTHNILIEKISLYFDTKQ
ncbi:MAG: TolC family protein [Campylobacterales bacterium]|nr:TolC family protein [Campylobacterales bacterium]